MVSALGARTLPGKGLHRWVFPLIRRSGSTHDEHGPRRSGTGHPVLSLPVDFTLSTCLGTIVPMEIPFEPTRSAGLLSRAWYSDSITEFLRTQPDTIVGRLTQNCDFTLLPAQKDAWLVTIQLLHAHLVGLTGSVFLEFNIPRMGRRVDAVVLVGPVVFVIEFKVGESTFERAAIDQVWDYALDLKNFHEASHSAAVAPILVATEAISSPPSMLYADQDRVYRPILVHSADLRRVVDLALENATGDVLEQE